MFIFLGSLVLVVIVVVYCESSGCPAPELIKPCVCEDNRIMCIKKSDIDLVNIFQTLEKNLTKSEKHLNIFYLRNSFITGLEGNTFKDITFDEIYISNCNQLTKIHVNAFAGTDLITKSLSFRSNDAFSDNSIFEVISKFVNLESLYLRDNNIREIPSNAFHKIGCYQDKLRKVSLLGNSIKKIGSRPFSQLRGLEYLTIWNTSIDYIPEDAFEFEEESNQKMTLDIGFNTLLKSSSFHQDSFTHFKRPILLGLGYGENQYEYLDEKVFKSFLISNPQNKIDLTDANLVCNNCKNLWLKKQPELIKRFYGLKCTNKKSFTDPGNFAKCGSE